MKNIAIATLATLMLATVAFAATNAQPATSTVYNQNISAAPCSGTAPCASQTALAPSEGSPMPVCQPGHNCNDDARLTASEGSPMPVCQPGHNCNDDVRLIASEGSPMPVCQPGHNCNDDVRLIGIAL
jgi:hypothetical protein